MKTASGEVGKKEKGNPSVKPTVCHLPFQGRLENGKWENWKKRGGYNPSSVTYVTPSPPGRRQTLPSNLRFATFPFRDGLEMASGEVGKKEKGNPSVKPTVCQLPFQGRLENGKWGGWEKGEGKNFRYNFKLNSKTHMINNHVSLLKFRSSLFKGLWGLGQSPKVLRGKEDKNGFGYVFKQKQNKKRKCFL